MKYSIIATALLAFSGSALADEPKNFGKIEYEYNQADGSTKDNGSQVNFQLGREIAPGLKVDGKVEASRTNEDGTLGDRLEVGATYSLGWLSVRGGVGEKFTNGDQYAYYLVEPGVKVPLDQNLSVYGKYRFRDAFDQDRAEETHRVKVGAEYALTKTSSLEASFARSWGDSQYNTVQIGYGFKF